MVPHVQKFLSFRIVTSPGTTNVQETKHLKFVESSFYNKSQKQEKEMVTFNLNLTVENNSTNASTPRNKTHKLEKGRKSQDNGCNSRLN